MTKKAFENAITVMLALGGSTNGVSPFFIFVYLEMGGGKEGRRGEGGQIYGERKKWRIWKGG